jgi:dTDP-4-amino-4,6-dideoxygalactose transaminase
MRNKFLVFGSPKIGDDEINEVVDSLQSGWLGTGPKVARFEGDFAAYKGVNVSHVAAVNSCTAALHLSLLAAGVGKGDEVITTPMTFCATINAIIHAGATPVLADIDPISMNIDPDCIEDVITPRTRAVLPVHFAGRPCDMDAIMNIAGRHDLKVIEDCAHAIETEYKGRKIGTIGDFGCFSFYVTKNIVTGEGGMVIAREKEDAEKIKVLALHGMSKDAWKRFSDSGYKHYKVVDCGFKYNMMDLQAAIGIHQLKHISDYWLRRQQIWNRYKIEFNDLNLSLPANPEPRTRHAYHLFTVLMSDKKSTSRDQFLDSMTHQNIGVGVHYLGIPEHPFYRDKFSWNIDDYPFSRDIGRATVSIPLSPALTDQDVTDVIDAVKKSL